MAEPTVMQAIDSYVQSVALARKPNTARAYANGLRLFAGILQAKGIDVYATPAARSDEDWIIPYTEALKPYAAASEQLYLTAVAGWYEFLAAERLATINLPRLQLLIRRRARKPGQRLPQFPRSAIDRILEFAASLAAQPETDERARLRLLRDRAFLIMLADTGLRIHEACNLRRGDIDWHENRALLIGKGDRQAVVRFSQRSLHALRDYLAARSALDGVSAKPLSSLPVFARHDKGAGRKVLPLTTATGRAIVSLRSGQALGPEARGTVTPHSFRHYFVTAVLRGSGGNLKMAQELARHRSISVTQRYAHLSDDELDRAYHEIFNLPVNPQPV